MATEPGPFKDSGNLKEIKAQDFGSLVLRVEKVGVWQKCIKPEHNFAVYQVRLRINVADTPSLNGLHWDIWRRFSEFADLHAEFGKPKLQVKFPPKTLWRKLSDEFLEERRALLDQYLQALAGEPKRRDNHSFRHFIYPRSRNVADQPAPASLGHGHSSDLAAVDSAKLSEEHKPGSSATDKTPMSSAATDSSSDPKFYEAGADPAPSSPAATADPIRICKKASPTTTLSPFPVRLTTSRAPVILMSVCTQARSTWSTGTPVDVYSNSSRSWRSGKILSIGKTSGYPRPAQEDALVVAYGDKNRCRKVLPRSSLELRAMGSAPEGNFAAAVFPEEKVSVSPKSMQEVEATANAWNEAVEAARAVLAEADSAVPANIDVGDDREDQSRSRPGTRRAAAAAAASPSTTEETPMSAVSVLSPLGEDAPSSPSASRAASPAGTSPESRLRDRARAELRVGERVEFPDGAGVTSQGLLRRNIGGVWRVEVEAGQSRWVGREQLTRAPGAQAHASQTPQAAQGSPPATSVGTVAAKAEMPENVLQTGSKTTVLASSMADVERGRTAQRAAAPRETSATTNPANRKPSLTRRKSTPIPSKHMVQPEGGRRKSLKPRWIRWITDKLPKPPSHTSSEQSPSSKQARPAGDFTANDQLNSLPNGKKGSKQPKIIQVLDKLRVDIPRRGAAERGKGPRPRDDRRLPDRLPPDHTVDVLDPNTQRRLSRIRHHLVIKARRHSPA